jgi:hypothetical protein
MLGAGRCRGEDMGGGACTAIEEVSGREGGEGGKGTPGASGLTIDQTGRRSVTRSNSHSGTRGRRQSELRNRRETVRQPYKYKSPLSIYEELY